MADSLIKINVLTPYRKGGPWTWGQDLVNRINKEKCYKAQHIHKLAFLLLSPLVQKCDLVHSVVPITYHLWNKPLILTVHGNVKQEKNLWSWMYPKAIGIADCVTVPSYFLKKKLQIDKAIVIPNGIDCRKFKDVREYKDKKKKINILTITKFYFLKKAEGVLNILDVLEKLDAKVSLSINFQVLGGGKYLPVIKKKSKKYKIKTNFYGFTNPLPFFKKADIFLYWSDLDNMPIVLMEAMAIGLPVITNQVGAVREIINHGHDGYIATDSQKYLQYLIELINKDKLQKLLGSNAKKTMETKFDWEIIIKKYLELYQNVYRNFYKK